MFGFESAMGISSKQALFIRMEGMKALGITYDHHSRWIYTDCNRCIRVNTERNGVRTAYMNSYRNWIFIVHCNCQGEALRAILHQHFNIVLRTKTADGCTLQSWYFRLLTTLRAMLQCHVFGAKASSLSTLLPFYPPTWLLCLWYHFRPKEWLQNKNFPGCTYCNLSLLFLYNCKQFCSVRGKKENFH